MKKDNDFLNIKNAFIVAIATGLIGWSAWVTNQSYQVFQAKACAEEAKRTTQALQVEISKKLDKIQEKQEELRKDLTKQQQEQFNLLIKELIELRKDLQRERDRERER